MGGEEPSYRSVGRKRYQRSSTFQTSTNARLSVSSESRFSVGYVSIGVTGPGSVTLRSVLFVMEAMTMLCEER